MKKKKLKKRVRRLERTLRAFADTLDTLEYDIEAVRKRTTDDRIADIADRVLRLLESEK